MAFVVVMLLAGRRVLPWAMAQVAKTGSRELFTLFVLACAVGVAYGAAEIFHVSFALGAFFAGMVMQESRFAHRAATESLPLQDAFAVLFFVAVGMLFDWRVLVENPWEVIAVLFTIIFGKSLCAFALVWALKYPLHTALTVAVSLAQIGEFSFILVGQAEALGLAKPGLVNLVVAGAILSIALNPVCFSVIPHVSKLLTSRWAWARKAAMRTMPFEALPPETEVESIYGQVVVAGNDRFIETFARYLAQSKVPMVVLTANEEIAKRLSADSIRAVSGLLTKEESWVAAHLHNAQRLILVDSSADGVAAAHCARRVSPEIPIVVVSRDDSFWTEAGIENVRSLLTADAAARLLAVKVEAAVKDNLPLGEPIENRHEKAESEAADAEQSAEESSVEKNLSPTDAEGDREVDETNRTRSAESAVEEVSSENTEVKRGAGFFSGLKAKLRGRKAAQEAKAADQAETAAIVEASAGATEVANEEALQTEPKHETTVKEETDEGSDSKSAVEPENSLAAQSASSTVNLSAQPTPSIEESAATSDERAVAEALARDAAFNAARAEGESVDEIDTKPTVQPEAEAEKADEPEPSVAASTEPSKEAPKSDAAAK